MSTPKLGDGVEFHLGMTIYLGGKPYSTSPETHVIKEIINYPGYLNKEIEIVYVLSRKGQKVGTDLRAFFSSCSAFIKRKIQKLQCEIDTLEQYKQDLEQHKQELEQELATVVLEEKTIE